MISDPRPEPWPGGRAESGGPDVPVMTARCYHGSAAENSKGARHHPGINQEVAPNESQRDPNATTQTALIDEALSVAPWLQ
jgi:hypothetical protein